jgi:hypothetical protein
MTKQEIYRENLSQLEDGVNCLIFFKKDGSLRLMMATRDIITSGIILTDSLSNKLNAHSIRCNINNGNIAVIDLLIGDVRSFSVDRLVRNIYLGECNNAKDYERLVYIYSEILNRFKEVDTLMSFDNLDIESKVAKIAEEIDINSIVQELSTNENIQNTQQEAQVNNYEERNIEASQYITGAELKI